MRCSRRPSAGSSEPEDGGDTWEQVLGGGTLPVNEFTDVAVAPDGVVYATLSRNGTNVVKIRRVSARSDGGGTWTTDFARAA